MTATLPVDALRRLVAETVDVAPTSVALAPIATGKFNSSYFVTAGERELVLRVAPPADTVCCFYERRMMRQEPALHALLTEHTSIPVAPVVGWGWDEPGLERDWLLLERLPGTVWTEAPEVDTDTVLQQIGAHLAACHDLTCDAYGYLGAHQPMPPQDNWFDAFWTMWRLLLADVEAVGCYSAGEVATLVDLLGQHSSVFSRQEPARLLQMDIWHQNILVDPATSQVTGILDWDRALWGDPEIEFAVLDYCGLTQPAFWSGYGAARDLSPEGRVRQIFYLLYELQKYLVIRAGRDGDPTAAAGAKQQVMDLVDRTFYA